MPSLLSRPSILLSQPNSHYNTTIPPYFHFDSSTLPSPPPSFEHFYTPGRPMHELLSAAFLASRSRVVRFFDLPPNPAAFLSNLFLPVPGPHKSFTPPISMWVHHPDHSARPVATPTMGDDVYAIFSTHEEACAVLSLSGSTVSVTPALEEDLRPLDSFVQIDLALSDANMHATQQHRSSSTAFHTHLPKILRPSSSASDLYATHIQHQQSHLSSPSERASQQQQQQQLNMDAGYTMSSNPPNPRRMFRSGDWICSSVHCVAHNFGRNLACIGCGHPRPNNAVPPLSLNLPLSPLGHTNRLPSPRFITTPSFEMPYGEPAINLHGLQQPTGPQSPYQTLNINHIPNHHSYPSPSSASTTTSAVSFNHPQTAPPHIAQFPSLPSSNPGFKTAGSSSSSTASASTSPSTTGSSSHHLLTPSGRALSKGGKVQNISPDPLTPCVMYWPDNEPLPEEGQLRPSTAVGVPHPPILNTGNRGPIEHQPGDWICRKCNYLNWRRRKVCQTCFPYAEGNGDSVSAAVQQDRIALLTSLMTQQQLQAHQTAQLQHHQQQSSPTSRSPFPTSSSPALRRPQDLTVNVMSMPPQVLHTSVPRSQRPGLESPFSPLSPLRHESPRSRAYQLELQSRRDEQLSPPIYQTSQPHLNGQQVQSHTSLPALRMATPSSSSLFPGAFPHQGQGHNQGPLGPGPLLPSFLQDIVQSPSLSPTSTSSADLSVDECHTNPESMSIYSHSPTRTDRVNFYGAVVGPGVGMGGMGASGCVNGMGRGEQERERDSASNGSGSSVSLGLGNIWRLDGAESKSLATTGVPYHEDVRAKRRGSYEFA